jgi:hypothetical protein
MKRKFEICQYGTRLYPTYPDRYSPSDWIEISISESSPSEKTDSSGAPQVSNSSASEASTEVLNRLTSSSPKDDLSDAFFNISHFFQARIEEIGADLPCCWSIEQFTRMVIGEEEVRDPSYLADVYSNLLECGFHSGYWEQAFDYITLLYGFI